MKGALTKIGKLRGRGASEWRVRGAQALASAAERAGLSSQSRLIGEADFLRHFVAPAGGRGSAPADAAALLEHFRRRTRPRFFASFDDPAATAAEWRRRFGAGERELLRRADGIVEGRFDLLGHRGLRFGEGPAPDWHLEPLSGRRAPLSHWSRINYLDPEVAGDKKIVWELNRHQHFLTLGRAYFLTGEERYAETFAAHLRSWAAANPPKVGINWASSLEVAFRTISWLWALHFFGRSPSLTPDLFMLAARLVHAHARHVETYLSTYFSPNTHLTGEALGLFYAGTLLPELRPARRWRRSGLRVLLAELERQVRPDGTYFEQASYYQRYTADFYAHLLVLAGRNEEAGDDAGAGGEGSDTGGAGGGAGGAVPAATVGRRLESLLDHLAQVTRPDGRATLYGDDDGGRLAPLDSRPADDFRAALSTGAVLAGRPDYKFVAGELAEETLWLLGPEGAARFDRLEARPPAETSRAFPDGGVYVMRDGWGPEADYLLVDCGPHGALSCGHSHADALSFELAARGRALLLDPGTFTYTGSAAERDRFRSTAAHNALVVDGASSSEPAGPFSWRSTAGARPLAWVSRPRFDYFEGEHDGYERLSSPARHNRAVLFLKGDYFVVRDRLTGAGPHRSALRFQFAPGCAPEIEGGGRGDGPRPFDDREGASEGGRAAGCVRERPRVVAEGANDHEGTSDREGAREGEGACEGEGARPVGGLDLFAFGGGAWRAEEGWVSRCYGAREAAPALVYEAQTEGGAEFFTFLVPLAADVGAARLARELEASGGRAFEMLGADEPGVPNVTAEPAADTAPASAARDLLLAGGGGRTIEAGGLASDFDLAWVRFGGGGELAEAVLVGGKRLALGGRTVVGLTERASYALVRREGGRLVVETDSATEPPAADAATAHQAADAVTAHQPADAPTAHQAAEETAGRRAAVAAARRHAGEAPAAVHAGPDKPPEPARAAGP